MRMPRERAATGVNLGLIVTPMLDMSFQILAFFIMTYHPSALEGQVTGSLAAHKVFGGNPIGATDPVAVDEQMRDILTVIVSAGEAGRPDKVSLKSAAEAVPIQVADANMKWGDAKRELARAQAPPQGRQRRESRDQDCRRRGAASGICPGSLRRLQGRRLYESPLCAAGVEVTPKLPKSPRLRKFPREQPS